MVLFAGHIIYAGRIRNVDRYMRSSCCAVDIHAESLPGLHICKLARQLLRQGTFGV